MNVGIVIVTHGRTGESLLEEAGFILGERLDDIPAVAFNQSENVQSGIDEIRRSIRNVDSGNGILVLTDLMGSSPSNLVNDVLEDNHAVMVTGVNLGMLIRVCNYRQSNLELLAQKAVDGGKKAVKIFQKCNHRQSPGSPRSRCYPSGQVRFRVHFRGHHQKGHSLD
jgi:PTS system mannose-specific IIA component